MPIAQAKPAPSLLTPNDHALVMIDHQPQMAFATKSIDAITLRNNAALLAKSARLFSVATVLTTVSEKTFSGPIFAEVKAALPEIAVIDRSTMNCWEDSKVTAAINRTDKSRIVMAGLWTSVCIVGPVASALDQGFQVFVVADACGDVSEEAHSRAMERMVQLGAVPMTSLQYLLELQRDWARTETYNGVVDIAVANGGAYGLGLLYAGAMFGGHEAG